MACGSCGCCCLAFPTSVRTLHGHLLLSEYQSLTNHTFVSSRCIMATTPESPEAENRQRENLEVHLAPVRSTHQNQVWSYLEGPPMGCKKTPGSHPDAHSWSGGEGTTRKQSSHCVQSLPEGPAHRVKELEALLTGNGALLLVTIPLG